MNNLRAASVDQIQDENSWNTGCFQKFEGADMGAIRKSFHTIDIPGTVCYNSIAPLFRRREKAPFFSPTCNKSGKNTSYKVGKR